jgi:UPF0755 protein
MSRALKVLLTLLAAVVVAVVLIGIQFNGFLNTSIGMPEADASFEIQPGMSFRQVSDALGERGIISHPTAFRLYARLNGQAGRIQAGEYALQGGLTPRQLLDKFVSGEVRLYSFTIVEGWNFRELLAALADSPVVTSTLQYEDWPALLDSIGAEASHPEGLFLPETYHFPKGTSDRDVLLQAYTLMQEVLEEAWANRASGLPISNPYEALILASIVEKETALAVERPRIAGVFIRRLQQRMRLQTDPTVIYGIGTDFDGNLTRRDLRTDTPYNTYTRGGLPPTPIALPGKAAINAALNPAPGTELYFVATGLGDGSHQFSDTKEQHDKAVQEYLARQRAARNRSQGSQGQ